MANSQPGPFSGLGNQMSDPEAAAKALLAQQLNHLSLSLYVSNVTSHLETGGDRDFQQCARRSHQAARAYFEALGLAKFEDKGGPPVNAGS